MRLACSGQLTAAQIAEQVGISRRQSFNWIAELKTGGAQMLDLEGAASHRTLSDQI